MALLNFEEFAGGETTGVSSSSNSGKSQPSAISFEDFAGKPAESDDGIFTKSVVGLKAMGGETAAIADLVLSIPGFMINVGAQLGGTIQARARGIPFTADPNQLNPVTAYGVGREMGREMGEPFMSPLHKLMQAFKSGEAYENAKTTKGMEKLMGAVEEAGLWVEKSTGGRVSRDAVPMFTEVLMASAAGAGAKPAEIPAHLRKAMREQGQKMKQQAEAEIAENTITPEEFSARVPVQEQINAMLGIRSPAEQAKITRQRRQDVKQAFERTPEQGGDYGSRGESEFRAAERLDNERIFQEGLEKDRIDGEAYEPGSRPKQERIGQAEILRILQKPGYERTAEDLITLREARKEGGNTSMEAQMLLGAAGLGAAAGALLDEDMLRGASLGALTMASPALLMSRMGAGGVKSRFKQSGAVKEPGGMWHPEAVERLAAPLWEAQTRGRGPDLPEPQRLEYQKKIEDHSEKMVRNYLNKYAGTSRDPLKDVEVPLGPGTVRWEELWNSAVTKKQAKEWDLPADIDPEVGAGPTGIGQQVRAGKIRPDETIFGVANFSGGSSAAIKNYLSHVGDYLRQNVKPEDLPRYDLVRAVRETFENDKKMAKQMEKATADSTKSLPVYKEYKDGFKWVELKLPEKLTEEQAKQVRLMTHQEMAKYGERDPVGMPGERIAPEDGAPDRTYIAVGPDNKPVKNAYTGDIAEGRTPEEAWLAGRLAEEGNIMGHCVGGYCPSVASGESRIFSLRDPKGRSHVTVEVQSRAERIKRNADRDEYFRARNATRGDLSQLPDDIIQIKGKQNRAPNKEYLPYVQDFVKEGKWGEVGDLENTGLMDFSRRTERRLLPEKFKDQRFLTEEELREAFPDSLPGSSMYRPPREEGFIDQKLLAGLGTIGLGGVIGSFFTDDPLEGAILGALAGTALAIPGTRRRLGEAVKGVDYLAGNISTRIRNISPALLQRARLYEMRTLTESHRLLHDVVPFMKEREKLPKAVQGQFDRALLTGDREAAARAIQGNPAMVAAWRQVRNVLNDLGKQLTGHGRFKAMKDDYFPRLVKDIEGLKEALGRPERTRLEQALLDAEKETMRSRGTPLTHIEVSSIVNREMQSFSRARGTLPGYAKQRGVKEITEQLQPFYYTPSESLYAYVRGAVQDLEMARFFGRDLAQVERGSNRYVDVDTSVGNIVGRELADKKMTPEQARTLEELLKSRFRSGERSASRIVQDVRNLGNIGLLGNIVSGATQGADALMAVYAHDMRSTIAATVRIASGRERITTKDFGLADHVAEEFSSTSRTADWLNKMFKYSGFSAIDRFGKNVQINAAISKYERWASTPAGRARIKEKYGKAYGEELPALITDLQKGNMTERVRALLFSELSDMQPISKLELPQGYLDNPNGRLIYMLKTFMLKQMDVVRRDVYNEAKKGNVGRAAKNATEYALVLGLAGATTDMVKDWLMGRPVDFEGTDVMENVLKTFGWGEFVRDKAKQGRPVEALIGTIAPPYRMMDDIIRRDPKAVQYIPLVGKLYYSWELGGKEEAELRKYRKEKKQGKEPILSPATEDYKEKKKEKRRSTREIHHIGARG